MIEYGGAIYVRQDSPIEKPSPKPKKKKHSNKGRSSEVEKWIALALIGFGSFYVIYAAIFK